MFAIPAVDSLVSLEFSLVIFFSADFVDAEKEIGLLHDTQPQI